MIRGSLHPSGIRQLQPSVSKPCWIFQTPNSSNIQPSRFISSKYELFTRCKNLCSFVSIFSKPLPQKPAFFAPQNQSIHPVFRKIRTLAPLQKSSRPVFSTFYELLLALQDRFTLFVSSLSGLLVQKGG
jgi:hypothetical protein